LSSPFGEDGAQGRRSSWAHWKARSGLPIVLIELFSLGVTAGPGYERIDRKSVISLKCGQFEPKFQVEGVAPPRPSPTNHFLHGQGYKFLTTLSLTVLTQRNFVADILEAKCDFFMEIGRFAFLSPLWGLRGHVRRSS